ncbi:MAG: hypothetical protein CBC35_00220 [Planctomycetes bacterium TMED75]|nr:hypothetical protein [Planctomycetaceae bacterium]OUU96955.1 MAG: hypothetical protein CBC35_00220 [Planctomycetes bacterium TMED75]
MMFGERRGWMNRDYVMLAGLLLAAVWFSREAWMDVFNRAVIDPENGHALFAPVVALYLFWLRRSRLQFIRYRPSFIGTLLVGFSIFMLYWGLDKNILAVWHLGAVLLLIGCLVTMTGIEVIRQFAPAILCLFFLIPTPGYVRITLAAPLQDLATSLTITILEASNIDAVRDGMVIQIGNPPKNVAIGEACNGMRMVFALFLVMFGFAFSAPFRIETRLLLLASCPIIALTCNVVRLVPTSLVYGHASEEFADQFHWYAGLCMLPLALLMMMGLIKLLNWLDIPTMKWRLVPQ